MKNAAVISLLGLFLAVGYAAANSLGAIECSMLSYCVKCSPDKTVCCPMGYPFMTSSTCCTKFRSMNCVNGVPPFDILVQNNITEGSGQRAVATLHTLPPNKPEQIVLSVWMPEDGNSRALIRLSGVGATQRFNVKLGPGANNELHPLTRGPVQGNDVDLEAQLTVISLRRLERQPVTLLLLGPGGQETPYARGVFALV